jgi:hypothetical protein
VALLKGFDNAATLVASQAPGVIEVAGECAFGVLVNTRRFLDGEGWTVSSNGIGLGFPIAGDLATRQ